MAEFVTLGLFLSGLFICIIGQVEVLYALFFGLLCFGGYAMRQGISFKNTVSMLLEGIVLVRGILIIFVIIGLLTASWRASGTIPFIVYHGISMIDPDYFTVCVFLLCCVVSFLTGTSFGTVSTVGVICMLISNTAGFDPHFTGGAILSGIFFGDRGSPMSSSAQLVGVLTATDVYDNVRRMAVTGAVPFILACAFYIFGPDSERHVIDASDIDALAQVFSLDWLTVVPALVIIGLAAMRIDAKIAMAVSVAFAVMIAIFLQGMGVFEMCDALVFGYRTQGNASVAALMDGGGLLSMLRVTLIVMISSSYSGVFLHTRLIEGIKGHIGAMAERISNFGAVSVTSVFAAMMSCNQTLAVMLTEQLCKRLYADKSRFALTLENTAIIIAPLIPWNIAGAMPVATLGVSADCLFYAVYLWLIPLVNLLFGFRHK